MENPAKDFGLSVPAREGDPTLPELIGRLGQELATLVDTKINLLKIEIKEDLNTYSSYGMMMGVGGVVATVGFALSNVSIAFLISTLFEGSQFSQPVKYALGFIITALLYLIIGTIIILRAKNKIGKQNPIPNRSLKELEKDRQWLKKEV